MSLAEICKRVDGHAMCRYPVCDCAESWLVNYVTQPVDIALRSIEPEIEQRERYESVPWVFCLFNSFTAWTLFLIVILAAGQYHH